MNEEMCYKLHFRFTAWFVSHGKNLLDLQTLSVAKFCPSTVNKSYHSHGVAFLLAKIVHTNFVPASVKYVDATAWIHMFLQGWVNTSSHTFNNKCSHTYNHKCSHTFNHASSHAQTTRLWRLSGPTWKLHFVHEPKPKHLIPISFNLNEKSCFPHLTYNRTLLLHAKK